MNKPEPSADRSGGHDRVVAREAGVNDPQEYEAYRVGGALTLSTHGPVA